MIGLCIMSCSEDDDTTENCFEPNFTVNLDTGTTYTFSLEFDALDGTSLKAGYEFQFYINDEPVSVTSDISANLVSFQYAFAEAGSYRVCLELNTNECSEPQTSCQTVVVESAGLQFLETIDFSPALGDDVSGIHDFDIANGYLYFIHALNIYRMDLSSNTDDLELIINDPDHWPNTLKVIDNALYYQGDSFWSVSDNILQINVDNISQGIETTYPITGVSRSKLFKNSGELFYVSAPDGFSEINNFYTFNSEGQDELLVADSRVFPENVSFQGNYVYFSSNNEVRRFDLNTPASGSTIVYTANEIPNGNTNDIKGFAIKDNTIYFTQYNDAIDGFVLMVEDLDTPDELPLMITPDLETGGIGYGKLIINDGKLYADKINDQQIAVFEL